MPVTLPCPHCQSRLNVPRKLIDAHRPITCPRCKKGFEPKFVVTGEATPPETNRLAKEEPTSSGPDRSEQPVVCCPSCGGSVINDTTLAGVVVSCPHCRNAFQMPLSPITIHCPNCSRVIESDNSLVGQVVTCPNCLGQLVFSATGKLVPLAQISTQREICHEPKCFDGIADGEPVPLQTRSRDRGPTILGVSVLFGGVLALAITMWALIGQRLGRDGANLPKQSTEFDLPNSQIGTLLDKTEALNLKHIHLQKETLELKQALQATEVRYTRESEIQARFAPSGDLNWIRETQKRIWELQKEKHRLSLAILKHTFEIQKILEAKLELTKVTQEKLVEERRRIETLPAGRQQPALDRLRRWVQRLEMIDK